MVQKFRLYFHPFREERNIHLYLPDDYYQTDERYPVMYMFDGHNLYYDSDATFGTALGMKEFMDRWGKKMIIVGVECANDDMARVYEYIPYTVESPHYGHIEGMGDQTVDWMVHELKPFIDSHYRTYPFREATAIGGYSLGGMMALFATVRYNEIFSKVAALSPAFVCAMEQFKEEIAYRNFSPDTRVYFSWGDIEDTPDYVYNLDRSIHYLEARLMEKGVKTFLRCQQGGVHNEGSWGKLLPEFMGFLWY